MKPTRQEKKAAKNMQKRDAGMTLTATKKAEKSFAGSDLPNQMYLPKKEPMAAKPAPAPAKAPKYSPPKQKAVFGTVKAQQKKQRGLSACYNKGGKRR